MIVAGCSGTFLLSLAYTEQITSNLSAINRDMQKVNGPKSTLGCSLAEVWDREVERVCTTVASLGLVHWAEETVSQ